MPISSILTTDLFNQVIHAGRHIKNDFRQPSVVKIKEDGSPVTDTDMAIHNELLTWANHHNIGYIGEEGNGDVDNDVILYVDPLDGTSSFAAGIPTVTIAASIMIRTESGRYKPIRSIIYEPITGWGWCGFGTHAFVFTENNLYNSTTIKVGSTPEPACVTTIFPPGPFRSFSNIRKNITAVEHITEKTCRSTALCGGLIASGAQHALAFGGGSAAEVCAILPILNGAGAVMSDLSGNPISTFELGEHKGKPDFLLPNGFLAACDSELWRDMLTLVEETRADIAA